MNEAWQQYLQSQGASRASTENHFDHFGKPEEEQTAIANGNILVPLTDIAIIRASGDDARSFLQGQLTNDIALVDHQTSQLSGYCNPKGRLLALFRITQDQQGYTLHLPAALLEKTLARLKMFVLMAKVTLAPAASEVVRLGLAGEQSAAALGRHLEAVPTDANGVLTTNGITVLRLPGTTPRFEVFGELAAIQPLWASLSAQLTPVGSRTWQRLDIEAGLPCVLPETVEMFIPQMLNLHVIDGVSFKKGCYPGQEVVARLHYRGKLKRHMHIVRFSSAVCPAPGTPLYSLNDGADGQSIGNIVVAHALPDEQCIALCVIANEHRSNNDVCLQGDTKETLELQELPYPFPSEQE